MQDQFGGDFRGARGARLAVLADDLDRIGLAADLQARLEDFVDLIDDEAVGFAEAGERAGLRAHMPDLDGLRLGVGRDHAQHCRRRERAEAARDHGAAIDAGAGRRRYRCRTWNFRTVTHSVLLFRDHAWI